MSGRRENPSVRVLLRSSVCWVSRGAELFDGLALRLGRSPSAYSFEGVGLSVSRHPEAWSRIAKLPGPAYRLKRADGLEGRFALVEPGVIRRAIAWAVREGWLTRTKGWRVEYSDDGNQLVSVTLRSIAEVEAEGHDPDWAEPVDVHDPTPQMLARWRAYFGGHEPTYPLEPVYAEQEAANLWLAATHQAADGWWWNDRLSVADLSAPRGVILPHAIARWRVDGRIHL